MVHLITINRFNRSGVWICNRHIVRFKWKLWRVNLNINIINVIIIESPHDSWKHRNVFGRRGPGFRVRYWRFNVTLSWWLIWFITMKGVGFIHISSNNRWEEFRSTHDSWIVLVSNTSTEFTNNLLSHSEICNNWLVRCCIIVGGRWRTKMMRALT